MNQQSYFMLTCVSLFMFFYSLCSTSARSLQISRISPCQQIFQEAVPRYKILCTVPILVVKSYLPLTTPHHLDSVLVDVMTCVVALASWLLVHTALSLVQSRYEPGETYLWKGGVFLFCIVLECAFHCSVLKWMVMGHWFDFDWKLFIWYPYEIDHLFKSLKHRA